MHALHSCLVVASSGLAAGIALLASPGVAYAQEPAAATAQPAAPKEAPEPSAEPEHKRFSIELNPLGVAIGRYSIQGEYLPAVHHAITLNPFFAYAPVTITANGKEMDAGSLTGFGGELGYRFYTGSKGPNGFYIGPSFIFASYSQSAPSGAAPSGSAGSDSFTGMGGAIDLGGQAVIGPGIVVGGGFGLQYTQTSKDIATENLNLASAIIAGGGVRPRFLVSVGYAF